MTLCKYIDIEKRFEIEIPNVSGFVTTTTLNTKDTQIENKIPDTTGSFTSPEFNRLTKISFDVRIKETTKSLVSKSQVDNALDIADKNREKKKKSGVVVIHQVSTNDRFLNKYEKDNAFPF